MKNRQPLKAAVIGGGLMGALMDTPRSTPPLTHAGGFLQHPDYDLVAICEPSPSATLREWPCRVYTDIDSLLDGEKPDIVSVAVPKEQQPAILSHLLNCGIQAVIAEKPLAPTLSEARILRDLYQQAEIPLLVNLSRRYSSMYRGLSEIFRTGDEKVLCASLHYGKGLVHNGIHAIDLARMLFGDVIQTHPLSAWSDAFPEDPSFSVFLQLQNCRQFHLNALDDKCFTCFELDIITDRKRYTITNDHRTLKIATVYDQVGIPPGKRLVDTGSQATDYEHSIMSLLDNARDVIANGALPLCDAGTICDSHAVIDRIIEQARENRLV